MTAPRGGSLLPMSDEAKKRWEKLRFRARAVVAGLFLVGAAWGIFVATFQGCTGWDVSKLGQLGDSMAPITAIATIAAFAAAMAGLLLQGQDLEEQAAGQKALLDEQRALVAAEQKTAEAMKASVAETRRQVDALLGQQATLTSAFADLTTEQRAANALTRHQLRGELLRQVKIEINDLAAFLETTAKEWSRAFMMSATADAATTQTYNIACSHLNRAVSETEAERDVVAEWIASHDAAAPGAETDRPVEVRELRDRLRKIRADLGAGELEMGPLLMAHRISKDLKKWIEENPSPPGF